MKVRRLIQELLKTNLDNKVKIKSYELDDDGEENTENIKIRFTHSGDVLILEND